MLPFARAAGWPSLVGSALALVLGAVAIAGCAPKIGDKCVLSTDCSTRGDRLCDTSQPEGYCTQFNCRGNDCPDQAACVLFDSALPGCGYDDRSGPGGARTSRAFCSARCKVDGDCRGGYVCVDPRRPPWNAVIIDDDQTQLTCLVKPIGWDEGASYSSSQTQAPVCGPVAPDVPAIDASAPTSDAGADGADAADASDASDGG